MWGPVFKKYFFSFICVMLISAPFLVFSQESTGEEPTATEGINVVVDTGTVQVDAPSEATASEQTESASSDASESGPQVQGYFIDNSKPENERVVESAVSTNQSYTTTHSTQTDASTEQPSESSESVTPEETVVNSTDETPAPSETTELITEGPQLTETEPVVEEEPTTTEVVPLEKPQEVKLPEPTRTFTKKIFVNKDAVHTCTAEVFTVDLSDRSEAQNTLLLTKEADISYEVEIGSLPAGIDVRFTENNEYFKQIGSTEETADFIVKKEDDAVVGSFSIPFIYTQKGVFDSSVICQINVVNR